MTRKILTLLGLATAGAIIGLAVSVAILGVWGIILFS